MPEGDPASPCQHRCRPPCASCLEAASATARGAPLFNDFTRLERLWYIGAIGLGGAMYLFSEAFPGAWQPWVCLASIPTVVIGIFGPYQFRIYREAQRAERGVCAGCGYGLAEIPAQTVTHRTVTFDLVACPECGVWNGKRLQRKRWRAPGTPPSPA